MPSASPPSKAITSCRSSRSLAASATTAAEGSTSADPEWPSTLEGFAKKAYDFFVKELRPLGYKLHAEIISFPGGMPGEVGLFLKW